MNEKRKNNIIFRAVAAMSLDGRIAKHASHFTSWTSPEDKTFLHEKLYESDAVIVGRHTYETAREPLSKRNCIVFTTAIAETKREHERLCYVNPNAVDVAQFVRQQGHRLVDVLGGTQTYSWFLRKNLLDELYITIEPIIFGSGLPLFDVSLMKDVCYKLLSVKQLNEKGSVLLHYTK